MNAALQSLIIALLVGAPRLAEACYVCSSGRDDETRNAFLLTTVFLSVLPLAIVGGGVWWLRRQFRRLEMRRPEIRRPEAEIGRPEAGRLDAPPA